MNTFVKFLLVTAAGLFILGGGLYAFRAQFIYLFVEDGAAPEDMPRTEVVEIPAFGSSPALTVWKTAPEPGQPVIVYFMGETGALSVHEPRLRDFAENGFGVAAMAYRGGGGQDGSPSEEALYEDALRLYAAMDRLFGEDIDAKDRVIYGYSLGSGIATRLAVEQEELALVLEAPFTTLCEASMGMAGLLPGCLMLATDAYDSLSRIDRIDAPLLILHGTLDQRAPIELGAALFEAAQVPKVMETYEGGQHEDLPSFGALQDTISFIRTLRGAR